MKTKLLQFANFKTTSPPQKTDLLFYGLTCFLVIQCFIMATSLIGLRFEGSSWFFQILNSGSGVTKLDGYRWSDQLWQLPALFSIKYLPQFFPTLPLYLLSFIYTLHPLLALILCYFLAPNNLRQTYMVFPVLSFAIPIMSTIAFNVGVSAGAISFFWPLFFIALFKDLRNPIWFASLVTLLVLLNFNYEVAIVLILLVGSLIYIKLNKDSNCIYSWAALVLVVCSLAFQIYRISSANISTTQEHQTFWNDLLPFEVTDVGYYGLFTIISCFLLLVFSTLFKKISNSVWALALIGTLSILLIGLYYSSQSDYFSLMDSRTNRTTVIPAVFLIGLICLTATRIKSHEDLRIKIRQLKLLSLPFMALSNIYVFQTSDKWDKFAKSLITVAAGNDGCIFLPNSGGMNDIVYSSILIQRKKQPSSIVFPRFFNCPELGDSGNACLQHQKEGGTVIRCEWIYIPSGNIDLTRTKSVIHSVSNILEAY